MVNLIGSLAITTIYTLLFNRLPFSFFFSLNFRHLSWGSRWRWLDWLQRLSPVCNFWLFSWKTYVITYNFVVCIQISPVLYTIFIAIPCKFFKTLALVCIQISPVLHIVLLSLPISFNQGFYHFAFDIVNLKC